MTFIYLFLSFTLLYLSGKILINLLTDISYLLTSKNQLARIISFLIFFPGVIVHELSHFFMASLLFVPTGAISFFPEKENLGSVKVAKSDPIRLGLIGLAPTFVGTGAIIAIFFYFLKFSLINFSLPNLVSLFSNTQNFLWLYLIFSINNTMFTSPSDRQSFFGLVALFLIVLGILYLFNLFPFINKYLLQYGNYLVNLITTAYASTFLINLIFIFPFYFIKKIILILR